MDWVLHLLHSFLVKIITIFYEVLHEEQYCKKGMYAFDDSIMRLLSEYHIRGGIYRSRSDFLCFSGFFFVKTDVQNLEHYTYIRISESVNLQKVFFSIFIN